MLEPKITKAGKDAIARAMASGQKFSFEKLWLGSGNLVITPDTLRLNHEEEQIAIETVKFVSQGRLHVTALADSPLTAYALTEIAFVASGGVPIAFVSGGGQPIAYKLKTQELLLAFDLIIDEIPTGVIEVTGSGERLNLDMAEQLAALAQQQVTTQLMLVDVIDRLTRLEASR